MLKKLKAKLLHMAIKKLVKPLTSEDLLRRDKNGNIYMGRIKLEENQVVTLSEQASRLYNSLLWRSLKTDIEYRAQSQMLNSSLNVDDLIASRIMILNMQQIDELLESLT